MTHLAGVSMGVSTSSGNMVSSLASFSRSSSRISSLQTIYNQSTGGENLVIIKKFIHISVYIVGWDERGLFTNFNPVIGAVASFGVENMIPNFFSLLIH